MSLGTAWTNSKSCLKKTKQKKQVSPSTKVCFCFLLSTLFLSRINLRLILLEVKVERAFSGQVCGRKRPVKSCPFQVVCSGEGPPRVRRGHLQTGQAEMAFIVVCDPISATDEIRCLRTIWRLCPVLADGLWNREEGGDSDLGGVGRTQGPFLYPERQGGGGFKKTHLSPAHMKPTTLSPRVCLHPCVYMPMRVPMTRRAYICVC